MRVQPAGVGTESEPVTKRFVTPAESGGPLAGDQVEYLNAPARCAKADGQVPPIRTKRITRYGVTGLVDRFRADVAPEKMFARLDIKKEQVVTAFPNHG